MFRSISIRFVLLILLAATTLARAGQFVTSVSNYSEGTFATVGGSHYTQTDAAKNKPFDLSGDGGAFPSIITPFSGPYEQNQLVAIGRTGSITLGFQNPVAVTGAPQIGIFTSAALYDVTFADGVAGNPAMTNAMLEFGGERTAVVEVGSSANNFVSLGRVTFDDPTNAYANASGPYQFPAPDASGGASYDKPYAGSSSDFNGLGFADVIAKFNGSAGGTWLTIPLNLGLSSVQFVRLSDPLWLTSQGLVEELPSVYFPPPDQFVKPADLFIDGAVLVPEPTGLALIAAASFISMRPRARRR